MIQLQLLLCQFQVIGLGVLFKKKKNKAESKNNLKQNGTKNTLFNSYSRMLN